MSPSAAETRDENAMVNDADHVVVLDQGRVIKAGTPESLIASGRWFARLAQAAAGPLVEDLAAEMEPVEDGQGRMDDQRGDEVE